MTAKTKNGMPTFNAPSRIVLIKSVRVAEFIGFLIVTVDVVGVGFVVQPGADGFVVQFCAKDKTGKISKKAKTMK